MEYQPEPLPRKPTYGQPQARVNLLAEVALAHSPLLCILTATGL